MRNFQLQTPQRDQSSANRRPKTTPDLNKNQPKVTKKSLNPAFKAASVEDSTVFQTLKEFTEASGENIFDVSAESLNPAFEAVSEEDSTFSQNLKEITESSGENFSDVTAENLDTCSSENLLETPLNLIIEEFHEEDEWLDKLLSRKSNLVILLFGMAIYAILICWFFNLSWLGSVTIPRGPPPT